MATVKGDVHDIGKSIVGVVLACNGYQILDLGVMVASERIVAMARDHDVAVVGLSGLITPSLDEMVHVAREMTRSGLRVPLLIGGATTSKKHTAVKIAPAYGGGVTVHVLDASKAAHVVGQLLSHRQVDAFCAVVRSEQSELRAQFEASAGRRALLAYEDARTRRFVADWSGDGTRVTPAFWGARVLADVDLAALVPYIDWTPFFHTWELRGKFPAILDKPDVGAAARDLYDQGRTMLAEMVADGVVTARAVYGFFPATSDGDDIVIYTDATCKQRRAVLPCLRQQQRPGADDAATYSLADFVAPRGVHADAADVLGAFVVTAGHGVQDLVQRYEAEHDDYRAIMVKALADRLAEALAEKLHEQARSDLGYADGESLSKQDLLAERYRGIRPAPGYPACPDHSDKRLLFELLGAEAAAGVRLTESMAMAPAASVAGWYFSHPQARYFSVGKIGRDQVDSYARRKGMPRSQVERWLRASLGYDEDVSPNEG